MIEADSIYTFNNDVVILTLEKVGVRWKVFIFAQNEIGTWEESFIQRYYRKVA